MEFFVPGNKTRWSSSISTVNLKDPKITLFSPGKSTRNPCISHVYLQDAFQCVPPPRSNPCFHRVCATLLVLLSRAEHFRKYQKFQKIPEVSRKFHVSRALTFATPPTPNLGKPHIWKDWLPNRLSGKNCTMIFKGSGYDQQNHVLP